MPAFLQTLPAFTAALAGIRRVDGERESIDKNAISLLFIYEA